ncbi:MAG: PadR family transcriptional regulator [Caldisericia bacterium]|nr:PadR family transcriptional regulator [Caldisericia bacterium]
MTKKFPKELMAASAVPVILSILQNGDNYGYGIIQEIKEITNGKTPWQEASIYPVLKKLEKKGLIKSYWRKIEDERHRKYYIILDAGKEELIQSLELWKVMDGIIKKLAITATGKKI